MLVLTFTSFLRPRLPMENNLTGSRSEKISSTAVTAALIAFVNQSALTYKNVLLPIIPIAGIFAWPAVQFFWDICKGTNDVLRDIFRAIRSCIRHWSLRISYNAALRSNPTETSKQVLTKIHEERTIGAYDSITQTENSDWKKTTKE